MEIVIIIICIIIMIPCIRKIQKDKRANSFEGIRAQFNSSDPVVDTRTLSPAEAKRYYYQQKEQGKEINNHTFHDLSNIIGKEYENMLLDELEDLVPEEVQEWVQNHVNAGFFFTDKVNEKIIELKISIIPDEE